MMACIKNLHRIREDGTFRAYLFGIARHEVYGHFRSLRTGPEIDFGVTSVCDLGPTPSQIIVQHKRQRALLASLRSLPLDLQIAIELHYWEGLTTGELAQALDIKQGTVKSRLRRAREMLAEAIARHDDADEMSVDEIDDWVRSIRAEARIPAKT